MTSWSRDLARTRFDVSDGIRKRVICELVVVSIVALTFAIMYFIPHYVFSSSGVHVVQVGIILDHSRYQQFTLRYLAIKRAGGAQK